MAALLSQFVLHVAQCLLGDSAIDLVLSVPLGPEHPFFGPLRQATQSVSPIASPGGEDIRRE